MALGQIGACYQGLKNYYTAINYFQKDLTIAEAINHSEYQALSQEKTIAYSELTFSSVTANSAFSGL